MSASSDWFDFNDASDIGEKTPRLSKDELKTRLLDNLEGHLYGLFPAGRIEKSVFLVGDIYGSPGQSLKIELKGQKKGMWKDHATDEGGDIFSLFAAAHNLDIKSDFKKVIDKIGEWLGEPQRFQRDALHKDTNAQRGAPIDTLGLHAAKYDYADAQGNLIACAYKYITEHGKTFRIWDVKKRRWQAPDPRPLYNQRGIAQSDFVILCEGEKCTDALIASGYCATTAIGGAKAPLDKTDWSPLKGKTLVIWPDNDQAGKDYAQAVGAFLHNKGLKEIRLLPPPELAPAKWDAADAVAESFDIPTFLNTAAQPDHQFAPPKIVVRSVREMLDDNTPMPPDLIGPRIMGTGDIGIIAGAPKVGKSDFVMSAAMHWAAGIPFLDMTVPRPLRILYFQVEIGYYYMRERIRAIDPDLRKNPLVLDNLIISDKFNLILNQEGVEEISRICLTAFKDGPPDLVILDPLRNLFDGGDDNANENDNSAMIDFFRKRVLVLQENVSKQMSIFLLHHIKKTPKKIFEEDPFQSISGAGAIRGFYTAGIILYKPDEELKDLRIYFELRNGPSIKTKLVTKHDGRWIELEDSEQRIANKKQGRKQDAERDRKTETIIELLENQAKEKGTLFTISGFAKLYEGQYGLDSSASIERLVKGIAAKGFIKFRKDTSEFGLRSAKSKLGFMVTENMKLRHDDDKTSTVLPSHYLDVPDGALMEVENPEIWVWPLVQEGRS